MGGELVHHRAELALDVGEHASARIVAQASSEDRIEGRLASRRDELEDRDVEQRPTVEHDRARMLAVLVKVVLGQGRSVRAAVQVDPLVSERRTDIVEIVCCLHRGVEAKIGVGLPEGFWDPRCRRRSLPAPGESRDVWERWSDQRVGPVPCRADRPTRCHAPRGPPGRSSLLQPTTRSLPSWATGEEEHWVGLALRPGCRDHHHVEVDVPDGRRRPVLGHPETPADGHTVGHIGCLPGLVAAFFGSGDHGCPRYDMRAGTARARVT